MAESKALDGLNSPTYPVVQPDWVALGDSLWQGLRGFAFMEVEEWQAHSDRVGQPLSEEGLRLWMARCQQGQCVVCGAKAKGKFCGTHEQFKKTP